MSIGWYRSSLRGTKMPLRHLGFIELPAHAKPGGFDHAAVDEATGRIYVAHTANDAVDIVDIEARKYLGSIENLTGWPGSSSSPAEIFSSRQTEGRTRSGSFASASRCRSTRSRSSRHLVCAFLPASHRVAVYRDHARTAHGLTEATPPRGVT
jgi:hypothetical protein